MRSRTASGGSQPVSSTPETSRARVSSSGRSGPSPTQHDLGGIACRTQMAHGGGHVLTPFLATNRPTNRWQAARGWGWRRGRHLDPDREHRRFRRAAPGGRAPSRRPPPIRRRTAPPPRRRRASAVPASCHASSSFADVAAVQRHHQLQAARPGQRQCQRAAARELCVQHRAVVRGPYAAQVQACWNRDARKPAVPRAELHHAVLRVRRACGMMCRPTQTGASRVKPTYCRRRNWISDGAPIRSRYTSSGVGTDGVCWPGRTRVAALIRPVPSRLVSCGASTQSPRS